MNKCNFFASTALCVLLMACGSTKSLEAQQKTVPISVQTYPNGAKVYVDGKLVSITTPAVINVPSTVTDVGVTKKQQAVIKEKNAFIIQIVKDGYETVKDVIEPKVEGYNRRNAGCGLSWPENLIYELKERADTRVN
ncbi:MAG: hypothetical protein J1E37_01170, partial [Prevotella sp.]|nr:hypothetical protein [Prevotella sp.]